MKLPTPTTPPTPTSPTSSDPTAELRAYLLSSWSVCGELNRNEILEIIRSEGGVCPLPPTLLDRADIQLFVTLGRMMIDAFSYVQHCSAGLWVMYLDLPTRRFTFAPNDVIAMAVEAQVVDKNRIALTLDGS